MKVVKVDYKNYLVELKTYEQDCYLIAELTVPRSRSGERKTSWSQGDVKKMLVSESIDFDHGHVAHVGGLDIMYNDPSGPETGKFMFMAAKPATTTPKKAPKVYSKKKTYKTSKEV